MWSRHSVLICTIVPLLLSGPIAAGSPQQSSKSNKAQAVLAGEHLYRRYCAVCHGNDGKGNGPPPTSSHFSAPPPDLTTLAQRHEGKFPEAYVLQVLRSGANQPDHGSSEMPVWGGTFKASGESDKAQANVRVQNLVEYLKSIQSK
jgi:mono/diheme cytochrome c family protein